MKKDKSYLEAERIAQALITEANKLQKEHIWYKTTRSASTIKKLLEQGIKEDELIYLLHNRFEYLEERGFSMHNFTFPKIFNKDSLKYVKTIRHLIRQSKYAENSKF